MIYILDLEPPDLCRACALTSLDSKSLLDLSTETKQRLDFCGQIDLEEYCLDRVMDNLGSDNANEIARQIQVSLLITFVFCKK